MGSEVRQVLSRDIQHLGVTFGHVTSQQYLNESLGEVHIKLYAAHSASHGVGEVILCQFPEAVRDAVGDVWRHAAIT